MEIPDIGCCPSMSGILLRCSRFRVWDAAARNG
jgi:hypothetical protein